MEEFYKGLFKFYTQGKIRNIYSIIFYSCLYPSSIFSIHILSIKKKYDHSDFDKQIAQLKIKHADSSFVKVNAKNNFEADNYANYNEPSEKNYIPKIKSKEFNFDPNTISIVDWKRLGIRDKTIETIQKYLSKGGHFYKAEDIAKIWGLSAGDIKRLLPYVRIENNKAGYVKNNNESGNYKSNSSSYEKKPVQIVDINSADSNAFIALPGIGNKLANRIIAFRDKLGRFYSVEQVHETFGLPDSTFQKIKSQLVINDNHVNQININTASLDDLKLHPYIRYNLAKTIIEYRTQHGNFSSVADLKNIMIITDDIYTKMFPYLIVSK